METLGNQDDHEIPEKERCLQVFSLQVQFPTPSRVEELLVFDSVRNTNKHVLRQQMDGVSFKYARPKVKTWHETFCCLTTSATHIELLHSYSARAFMLGWNKFTLI